MFILFVDLTILSLAHTINHIITINANFAISLIQRNTTEPDGNRLTLVILECVVIGYSINGLVGALVTNESF